MKKILNEKHLEYVNFYIQFIEEILPDKKTGKKKLIVKGE
jgi:phenylacetate-CoA ligase